MTFGEMTQKARQATSLRALVARSLGAVLAGAVATATVFASGPIGPLGNVDVSAWLDAVPALPTSPQEAATRAYGEDINGQPAALRGFYQPFYDKLEAFAETQRRALASTSMPQGDDAASRNAADTQASAAMTQANAIPIIAQMGGIESLAKMTPDQRAAAAQQMARMLQQNPAAVLSATAAAPAGPPADAVRASMAVRQDLARMTQEFVALETTFQRSDIAITAAKGSHQEIAALHSAKAAKIPLVVLGETGREPDPVQLAALTKATTTQHRDRAVSELTARRALMEDQSRQLKRLAMAYREWLAANRTAILASSAPDGMLTGMNTLVDVATYEMRFIEAVRRLAEYSEAVTLEVSQHDLAFRRLRDIKGR